MSEARARRVGIMGGTFDPIHYGHLVAAEEAREAFRLDKIIFVPAGTPPHKVERQVTPARHRYLMTLLAIMGNPGFEASRVDLDRGRVTYTVDTLQDLRKGLPDTDMYFITGADAILEILSWKAPKEVLSLAEFIAVTRPGYGLDQLATALGPLYEPFQDRIHILEMPPMGISSTDLRRRLAEGRSIRYLLPEAVATYIQREGLYGTNDQGHLP
ncbi:MAG: nicotinate-nucleotide adenylyltransferase [Firmicutes bacterium]|nr:nicotinate-nucleotide adenylyltransferase [Bacillota bacterium]